MTFLTVFPKFNKKNYLEILIKNNFRTKIKISKVCFSLIYSIKSVEGARIHKQLGRYYELKLNKPILSANKNSLILIKMQSTKLGTYNMSCGPEGMFIVDMQDKIIKIFVKKLIFKNKISFPDYKKINNLVKIPIIPQPKKFEINNQFLKFNNNFFTKDNKVLEIVSILNPIIKTVKVNFKSQKGIKIFFKERKFNKEEYIVEISKNYIKIIASNHGGRVYALISLLQLIHYYKNKLPLGIIKDKPQFKWRGMHLDCARQFHSVQKIKRLFEYMVLFKLNRFHWHLSDNEAWRLELNSFPNLAKQSSFRGYHEIIPPVYGSGYNRYGGYYSIRDVKDIIQYENLTNKKNLIPLLSVSGTLFAYFSIVIVNFGDFSRYVSSEKELKKGNLSLLLNLLFFSFLAVLIVLGADIIFNKKMVPMDRILTNPTDIIGKFDNTYLTVIGLLFILVASSSTNLIANYNIPNYKNVGPITRIKVYAETRGQGHALEAGRVDWRVRGWPLGGSRGGIKDYSRKPKPRRPPVCCPSGWRRAGNRCYKRQWGKRTWNQAAQHCRNQGATLPI